MIYFILFDYKKQFCSEHICTESLQEFFWVSCQDLELLAQRVSWSSGVLDIARLFSVGTVLTDTSMSGSSRVCTLFQGWWEAIGLGEYSDPNNEKVTWGWWVGVENGGGGQVQGSCTRILWMGLVLVTNGGIQDILWRQTSPNLVDWMWAVIESLLVCSLTAELGKTGQWGD